jgi:hypothetical protein
LGNKIEGYWQKFEPERPVAVWKVRQRNSRFLTSKHSTKISCTSYMKTPKRLKQRINPVRREKKKPMLLRHDKARLHIIAATSEAIQSIGFQLLSTLPTTRIWHRLTSGCSELSRNISKAILSHVATEKCFREQSEKFHTDGFEELVQRWRRCVEREGDYVET